VEYKLTEFGLSLDGIIIAMCDWKSVNLAFITEARRRREGQ
jgi:DNA-binding HxlR family transcriptional regulator